MRHIGNIKSAVPKRTLVVEEVVEFDETSRNPKAIMNYIKTNAFLCSHNELKDALTSWYYGVGVGKISVRRLRDLLINLYKLMDKDTVRMERSIKYSIRNRWLAFYDVEDTEPIVLEEEEEEEEEADVGF